MLFFVGFIVGAFVFEPLILNYVYLSNVYLFYDVVLTNKNRKKLDSFVWYKLTGIKRCIHE